MPAKVILVSKVGVPVVVPIWIERDREQLLFLIGDSRLGSFVVEAVREHSRLAVWVEDEEACASLEIQGTATLSADGEEVAYWDRRIWERYLGPMGRVHSSEHSELLVRLTPESGEVMAWMPEALQDQYYSYPGESAGSLLRKVLFQVNRHMASRNIDAPLLDEKTRLVDFVDAAHVREGRGTIRVDKARLVPISKAEGFISEIFEGGPNWVKVAIYISRGVPRLVSFCAAPKDATRRGGILVSWRDDVALELL